MSAFITEDLFTTVKRNKNSFSYRRVVDQPHINCLYTRDYTQNSVFCFKKFLDVFLFLKLFQENVFSI